MDCKAMYYMSLIMSTDNNVDVLYECDITVLCIESIAVQHSL